MIAHSACWCQCSSRMPPAESRMLTPEISVEIGEVGLGHLAAPAAVLDAPRREVERGPELGRAADVGGGRGEEGRHGAGERVVVRAGGGERRGVGDVDGTLRRLVRVAERRCTRGTRCHHHSSGRTGRQHLAA